MDSPLSAMKSLNVQPSPLWPSYGLLLHAFLCLLYYGYKRVQSKDAPLCAALACIAATGIFGFASALAMEE